MSSQRILLALVVAMSSLASQSNAQDAEFHAQDFAMPLDGTPSTLTQLDPVADATVPASYDPWWEDAVSGRLASEGLPIDVSVASLTSGALQYSAQIRTFSDLPLIREQTIGEEQGLFDWRAFAETEFRRTSDPVGNTLVTGGPTRFRENDWQSTFGMRRRNYHGGDFEIAQDFGTRNNNSIFFVPQNQGTARLRLSYIQPLMRGRGVYYNTSQIYLAMLDAAAADDEFSRQLQSQVLEVARAYWALYVERATLLQRVKLTRESQEIYAILNKRRNLDVGGSQILRARSAVAERRSLLARSQTAVRNAESRIIRLVNDPELEQDLLIELLPKAIPDTELVAVDMKEAKVTALELRPEIAQTRKQIAAAARRRDIAENELMPVLNAIVETYLAGLNGSNDVFQSFADQFSEGEPGYAVGLVYEYPICNRTARSRYQRRRLELRQLQSQMQTTIETLMLEIEVAVREVETSFAELQAKYLAMEANDAEVTAIRKRWQVLAGNDPSATLFLDNLLDAQVRLALSENDFAQAVATYNLSLVSLARAKGTLLEEQKIDITRFCSCNLPTLSASQSSDYLMEGSTPSADYEALPPAEPEVLIESVP